MNSVVVPTKVLTEPAELERILQSGLQQTGGIHPAANGYTFDAPPQGAFGTETFQVCFF